MLNRTPLNIFLLLITVAHEIDWSVDEATFVEFDVALILH